MPRMIRTRNVRGVDMGETTMGEILFFKLAEGPRQRAPADDRDTGRILFFTGVRYQAYIEPIAASGPSGPEDHTSGHPARKRKRRA